MPHWPSWEGRQDARAIFLTIYHKGIVYDRMINHSPHEVWRSHDAYFTCVHQLSKAALLFRHESWLTHHDAAYILMAIDDPEPQEGIFMAAEVMTKQAADDLNVSLLTRERRLRAGIIPVVTFGSQMLLRKERLDAVLGACERRCRSTAAVEVATSGPPRGRDEA